MLLEGLARRTGFNGPSRIGVHEAFADRAVSPALLEPLPARLGVRAAFEDLENLEGSSRLREGPVLYAVGVSDCALQGKIGFLRCRLARVHLEIKSRETHQKSVGHSWTPKIWAEKRSARSSKQASRGEAAKGKSLQVRHRATFQLGPRTCGPAKGAITHARELPRTERRLALEGPRSARTRGLARAIDTIPSTPGRNRAEEKRVEPRLEA